MSTSVGDHLHPEGLVGDVRAIVSSSCGYLGPIRRLGRILSLPGAFTLRHSAYTTPPLPGLGLRPITNASRPIAPRSPAPSPLFAPPPTPRPPASPEEDGHRSFPGPHATMEAAPAMPGATAAAGLPTNPVPTP
ncbi:hypothetical protein Vafri_21210 [Volvox africanus]|uniref:Uncharacterized protein n=1 Tax=Volvox africanus TaxID=51714 RepID=A0A8J4BT64_9CHLO|nr:hypothetical protein Vafri_21210 [Volvox africanus]